MAGEQELPALTQAQEACFVNRCHGANRDSEMRTIISTSAN